MRRTIGSYDVVLVGGGHAGWAARLGAGTLLLTHRRTTIGEIAEARRAFTCFLRLNHMET